MPRKDNKIRMLEDIREVRAYLARVGAEGRSLKTAVIEEKHGSGYWRDIATIKFDRDGQITSSDSRYAPTDEEAAAIVEAFKGLVWPELKLVNKLPKIVPDDFKSVGAENMFEFRNTDGLLIMVQLRKKTKDDRGKAYFTWTYWDDDEWRCQEPDGLLPLWGMDKLGDNTDVFIHEGAKAARAMNRLLGDPEAIKAHPWGGALSGAAHLGWVGGALSPQRTDWGQLRKLGVSRAYVVADNDKEGVKAVPKIARRLKMPCFHVQFTGEWPTAFDMADPWPPKMFRDTIEVRNKKKHHVKNYIGPSFNSCVHPATWATDVWERPNPKGKPTKVISLRDEFYEQWLYCEEADLFVHGEFTQIIRDKVLLNNMLAPFSDVADTAKLILQKYTGRRTSLCYRPDLESRVISSGGSSAINLHVPSEIKPVAGDIGPWTDFMEFLVPDEKQRHEVYKWCATLISRPEVRMEYALLMVGRQGVGKSTLGEGILAPLVGVHNYSIPSEHDIVDSSFNEWMAHKRLAVIHEIYQGGTWRAYKRLKSVITEKTVEVNKKFERQYKTECYMHVYACSNFEEAIKVEKGDRRWFYPTLAEGLWTFEQYQEFHNWLHSGGLNVIRHWADDFGDYVKAGQHAPDSQRKTDLIEASRSEAEVEAQAFGARLAFEDDGSPKKYPLATTAYQVKLWLHKTIPGGKIYEGMRQIRKALEEGGLKPWVKSVKINGRLETPMVNDALLALLASSESEVEANALIRKTINEIEREPL